MKLLHQTKQQWDIIYALMLQSKCAGYHTSYGMEFGLRGPAFRERAVPILPKTRGVALLAAEEQEKDGPSLSLLAVVYYQEQVQPIISPENVEKIKELPWKTLADHRGTGL